MEKFKFLDRWESRVIGQALDHYEKDLITEITEGDEILKTPVLTDRIRKNLEGANTILKEALSTTRTLKRNL